MHRILSARHGFTACLISLTIAVAALVEPLSAVAGTGGWGGV